MTRRVVLVPPSEGKASGGTAPWTGGSGLFGRLAPDREALVAAVHAALGDAAWDDARALKLTGGRLAEARLVNARLPHAPSLRARERFTGVLWDALDPASLPAPARRRVDRDVVVVSALAGLVGAGDPLPDHRLPMDASLPGTGPLASWWRPRLAPVLAEHVEAADVWDLLPGAYAAALYARPPVDGGFVRWWTVQVLRETPRGRVVVSHDNKACKGAFARWLVTGGSASTLAAFEGPGGYRVDLATSTRGRRGGTIDLVGTGH